MLQFDALPKHLVEHYVRERLISVNNGVHDMSEHNNTHLVALADIQINLALHNFVTRYAIKEFPTARS